MLAFGQARVPKLLVHSRAACAFTASCMAALEREEQRRIERRGEHLQVHLSVRETPSQLALHTSEHEGGAEESILEAHSEGMAGQREQQLPIAPASGRNQRSSEAIRGHQRSSEGNQRPSEAIRGHRLYSPRLGRHPIRKRAVRPTELHVGMDAWGQRHGAAHDRIRVGAPLHLWGKRRVERRGEHLHAAHERIRVGAPLHLHAIMSEM